MKTLIKVTFILKDLSDAYYNGNGGSIIGLLQQTDMGKFARLTSPSAKDLGITCKIGNGSFRDRVELSTAMKSGAEPVSFKLEPRRGYKLATFEFEA